MKKMRITFILPFVNLTGGIKILFEHANQLVGRGHTVTIIYPGVLFHGDHYGIENRSFKWQYIDVPLRRLKYWLFVDLLRKTEADWFALDRRVILHRTPDLSARFIPEADIVIATANETADWVNTYPASKGVKVFFCQDYEVWARPAEYVDKTLGFDMHLITIGSWQKKLFEETFNHPVEAVIPNGVDTNHFSAKGRIYAQTPASDHKPVRILMNYHHLEYKGIPDGFAAIEMVKATGIPVQVVMFGVHPRKKDISKDVEYHYRISEEELPTLYRSCDIFLWPTHREGFGLPPMEAMACGTPVVATDTGAVSDYIKDGSTGFMVPIKQPKALGEKLLVLAEDPKLREKMGKAASATMYNWGWPKQTDKLEHYLASLLK